MKGEILDIEAVQEMAKSDKEKERLRRDRNFFELEKKRLEKELDVANQRLTYLEKINKLFELIETYLPHRIKQIEDKKDVKWGIAVLELQRLADSIKISRNKIDNKEVEEDEEI